MNSVGIGHEIVDKKNVVFALFTSFNAFCAVLCGIGLHAEPAQKTRKIISLDLAVIYNKSFDAQSVSPSLRLSSAVIRGAYSSYPRLLSAA